MTDPVAARVLEIVAAQARRPLTEVSPEHSPADLGLDSLNLVEMVFAIEEAFDITMPFSAHESGGPGVDTATIGGVIDTVRKLVAAKAT